MSTPRIVGWKNEMDHDREPIYESSDIDGPAGQADGLAQWLRMQEGSAKQNAIEAESRGTQLIAAVWADRAVKFAEAAASITQLRRENVELRAADRDHASANAGYRTRMESSLATVERERDSLKATLTEEFRVSASRAAKVLALETALTDLLPPNLMWKEIGPGTVTIQVWKASLRQARAALEQAKPAAALSPDKGVGEP